MKIVVEDKTYEVTTAIWLARLIRMAQERLCQWESLNIDFENDPVTNEQSMVITVESHDIGD